MSNNTFLPNLGNWPLCDSERPDLPQGLGSVPLCPKGQLGVGTTLGIALGALRGLLFSQVMGPRT